MSETDKTSPPRRTIAVTVAGYLLLLAAAAAALMAVAFGGLVDLLATVILGCAGVAIIFRWSGWRIWAGTIAWVLIAIDVLGVFALFVPPAPPGADSSFGLVAWPISLAVAVFVLIAKRRERRPDFTAVFR